MDGAKSFPIFHFLQLPSGASQHSVNSPGEWSRHPRQPLHHRYTQRTGRGHAHSLLQADHAHYQPQKFHQVMVCTNINRKKRNTPVIVLYLAWWIRPFFTKVHHIYEVTSLTEPILSFNFILAVTCWQNIDWFNSLKEAYSYIKPTSAQDHLPLFLPAMLE